MGRSTTATATTSETRTTASNCRPTLSSLESEDFGDRGSSIPEAVFNFTNSIVGAGAIGLGGAIAISGGAISIVLIIFFGLLTKLSLDLVIRLSVETDGAHGSYEDLAKVGLGSPGRILVLLCKLAYSFGCLVAYVIVVKDNFSPALQSLLYGNDWDGSDTATRAGAWFHELLSDSAYFTWIISVLFVLPLCLLRDMTPLASFSVVSVISMISIVGIVIYIFFATPEIRNTDGTFFDHWIQIRPGILER